MHGSEIFFSVRGQTFDEREEYFPKSSGVYSGDDDVLKIIDGWDNNFEKDQVDECYFVEEDVRERKNETDLFDNKAKYKSVNDMRMQEIERILLEKAIFRIIYGNLCIWKKNHYKQLDFNLFTETVRKILPKELQERISRFGRFRETWDYMCSNCEIKGQFSQEIIEKTKRIIAFKNGFLDAKTMDFFQPSPEYPVLFRVEAKYKPELLDQTCAIDQIIYDATDGDEEVLDLFYEMLGYICSQGNEAKKFFLFATAPDSGKSIIGEFIGRLLGEENISTIALNDFGKRFALGNIANVTLNYNMDLPDETLDKNSVQKIKQLTGDPKIDCEKKYEQNRTLQHHCKFLFASNHPLKLKNDDEAFYNRLILIPFINSVSEEQRDFDLMEKLWKERDAVATKAAYAYNALINHNFVFTKSKLAECLITEWRENTDDYYFHAFFKTRCQKTGGQEFVPTEIIFREFKDFCETDGRVITDDEKPIFSKKFKSLFGLDMAKKRVTGYNSPLNGFLGLKLLNTDNDEF